VAASATARVPPIASPIAARVSESSRCSHSEPSTASRRPVSATRLGAGTFSSGSRPVRAADSQSTSNVSGLISRYQRRGPRDRRRFAGAGVPTTGAVAVVVTGTPG
jgi:hypothetical protein